MLEKIVIKQEPANVFNEFNLDTEPFKRKYTTYNPVPPPQTSISRTHIIISSPTVITIFPGKYIERPTQFLKRIEEFTETVNGWGEQNVLHGISQFLDEAALE